VAKDFVRNVADTPLHSRLLVGKKETRAQALGVAAMVGGAVVSVVQRRLATPRVVRSFARWLATVSSAAAIVGAPSSSPHCQSRRVPDEQALGFGLRRHPHQLDEWAVAAAVARVYTSTFTPKDEGV
jgi:hypothetical protein